MIELIAVTKNDGSILYCTASELAARVINSNLSLVEIMSIATMSGYDITNIIRDVISWADCCMISDRMKYEQACNLIASLRDQLNERSSE